MVRPPTRSALSHSIPRARSSATQIHRKASPESNYMSNRLFVGNLSFNTSQADLEAFFAAAGEVREVAIPTDRETGQPRGFGFVTMGDASAATAAISQLNGATLDGRVLKVNEAQERTQRGGGGGGGGRGGGRRY